MYSVFVVTQKRLDWRCIIAALIFRPQVKSQVDTVEVTVQKKSLVDVEGETFDEVAEASRLSIFGDMGQLFCDSTSDGLVAFWTDWRGDQVVKGEKS